MTTPVATTSDYLSRIARVREVMERMKQGVAVELPRSQSSFRASRMDDAQIERVIAQMWQDWQYVIDPHTACAFTGMAQDSVSVVLATASPASARPRASSG